MNIEAISPSTTANDFRDAMRNLTGGVSLITIPGIDGEPQGMLATAVSSVTDSPPTVLVCIRKLAAIHDALITGGTFCVNFLAEHHLDLAQRFSSPEARQTRFQHNKWMMLHSESPVLEDALSSLDCSLEEIVEVGSHNVIFGRVLSTRSAQAGWPLLYFNRNYGGFSKI
jgi:flavin reductase (DIM6/NTAB) family NADH-FMN oxidoreductase RutF